MLSAGTPAGQEEAAGAIMNLVTESPKRQKAVADAGGIMPLVMLLTWGTAAAREQAAAALGNLAHKNEINRKAIVAAQALPALIEMVKGSGGEAAKDKGAKPLKPTAKGGKTTGGGKVEAANCLRVLLESDKVLQAEVVEEGALQPIVALLKDKTSEEAGTRLLAGFADCFEDLIETEKTKSK